MFTARLIPRPFLIFLLASAMAARGGIAHCQELTQEQRHRFGVMNVFDPFASESNVTANVGERRILMRPGAFGLDYFPYLVALLACGGRPLTRRVKGVIVFGVVVNLFGAITFGRFAELYY